MWWYSSKFGENIIASALHYTKPVAYPAAYDDFLQITNTSSSMRMDSLYNFTQELGQADGYKYGEILDNEQSAVSLIMATTATSI